jgi:hypothetical protein
MPSMCFLLADWRIYVPKRISSISADWVSSKITTNVGMTPFDIKVLQMINGGLGAFASKPKEVILVNHPANFIGQADLT